MHIVHVALQGCLKAEPVAFGLTADTGGHIRYLLDLVNALAAHPCVTRQTVVTRLFDEPSLGPTYARPREPLGPRCEIVRLAGTTRRYLAKEELWRDMPALAEAFLDLLTGEGRPDLVHAHYADAGALAFAAKTRFGVPYFFTAHSLGRIKRLNMGRSAAALPDLQRALARREAVEDEAIEGADLIIASSRDEAEGQFGTYPSARPERIRVIAPGCSLSSFEAAIAPSVMRSVAQRIETELDDPSRAPVLALARPVWRKNLAGLVHAFAANPWLVAHANLIIFAGSSHEGPHLSQENRDVLADLRRAIAHHGLTGRVALPSHHASEEVPAIYAYARSRGGVFANPALHEPFGLTLIEAAAAGLPVVATDRGGPRDILADCRHGHLADPTDPITIGNALETVLRDPDHRRALADAGRANVLRYTWSRHASAYVRAAENLMTRRRPRIAQPADALLLSDIDGTLVGDGEGLAALTEWLRKHPRVVFGIATGRSFHDAIGVLQRHGAPTPAVMVTSVGSEIYYTLDEDYGAVRDEAWSEAITTDWWPDAVADALEPLPFLTPQPPMEQRAFKRSWFGDLTEREVARVSETLEAAALPATVIYSHGRFLDVVPARASKGQALTFVRKALGLSRAATASAGDSGNDRDLLTAAGRGIVVANHCDGLHDLARTPGVRFARHTHAAGIVEGLSGWPPAAAATAVADDEMARADQNPRRA